MSAPQVVPASFFRRPSFLTDLAATASRCVFHVRHVSSVTPRKVGLSTCGTGMSSSFSITFSFTVESERSVACVLLQLISMHHSSAQELTFFCFSSCLSFSFMSPTFFGVRGRVLSSCRVGKTHSLPFCL